MEEKGKGVKGGCRVRSYENGNGTVEVLERDCGDFIEINYVKGVIYNKPRLVAAVGEIPDELKLEGAISFWFAAAPYRYPKTLPDDFIQRLKVLRDAYKESMDKNLSNFILGLNKARGSSSSGEKETHSDDSRDEEEERPVMIHVNLAVSLLLNPILKQPIEVKEKEKGVKRNFESPSATQRHFGDSTEDERRKAEINQVFKEAMANIAYKKARLSCCPIYNKEARHSINQQARSRTTVENNLAASLAPSNFNFNCAGGFQHCYINEANIVFDDPAGGAQGAAEVQGPPHASSQQAAMQTFNRFFRGLNNCYINKANFIFRAGTGGAQSGAEVEAGSKGSGDGGSDEEVVQSSDIEFQQIILINKCRFSINKQPILVQKILARDLRN